MQEDDISLMGWGGLYHKHIIIYDAFRVIKMMIVSDATTWTVTHNHNGTARFKNVNNCLKSNIYPYLETSG